MKQRILAMILILTVMASVIFTGAITRSFADAPGSYPNLVLNDFKNLLLSKAEEGTGQGQTCRDIIDIIETNWENNDFNVWIIIDTNTGNFAFLGGFNQSTGTHAWQLNSWTSPDEYQPKLYAGNSYDRSYFRERFYGVCYNDSYRTISIINQSTELPAKRAAFNFNSDSPDKAYCTPFEWNQSGVKCYSLRTVTGYKNTAYTLTANIQNVPLLDEIEFIKFNVGDDWYISTVDQRYMRSMQKIDDEFDYFVADVTSEYDTVTTTNFFWNDLVGVYVPDDSIFENVISGVSILALPINDFIGLNVKTFSNFTYWHNAPVGTEGVRYDYQTGYSNQVIQIQLDPEEKDVSDNKAWEEFANYTNNYNITQVIPQTLPDQIFNTSGAKLLPCTVQVPDAYYDANGLQSNPPINVFKWGFGSYYSQLMYNFELFDVAIIPNNGTAYGVRYFYDTSLSPASVFVDVMDLKSLFASYDIVIIVPDDDGVLHENHSPVAAPLAYTGSGSQGILYTTDPIFANAMMGFCVITSRALQKQQLFNFNNGLKATYQLMSDYVESEDSWKASFLQWSSSIYWKIDTLNGSLGSILTKLGDIEGLLISIKNSLDNLSSESDPDNLQPWYLSLWNFIINFKPSDNDFTATLNQYDNNWDNIPELPAPSTIPLLPESTPVPVISGGA